MAVSSIEYGLILRNRGRGQRHSCELDCNWPRLGSLPLLGLASPRLAPALGQAVVLFAESVPDSFPPEERRGYCLQSLSPDSFPPEDRRG